MVKDKARDHKKIFITLLVSFKFQRVFSITKLVLRAILTDQAIVVTIHTFGEIKWYPVCRMVIKEHEILQLTYQNNLIFNI